MCENLNYNFKISTTLYSLQESWGQWVVLLNKVDCIYGEIGHVLCYHEAEVVHKVLLFKYNVIVDCSWEVCNVRWGSHAVKRTGEQSGGHLVVLYRNKRRFSGTIDLLVLADAVVIKGPFTTVGYLGIVSETPPCLASGFIAQKCFSCFGVVYLLVIQHAKHFKAGLFEERHIACKEDTLH